jgi:hypothetical protein
VTRGVPRLARRLALPPLLVAAAAAGGEPALEGGRLERRTALDPAPVARSLGSAGPEWLGYSIPGVADAADLCCHARQGRQRVCSLVEESGGWGSQREQGATGGRTDLIVLAEVERGRVLRLLPIGASCPVRADGRTVQWLDGVDAEASLEWLVSVAESGAPKRVATGAVAALAHHDGPGADRRLRSLALDAAGDRELRESAIFWSGAARGADGFALLDEALDGELDAELRRHALFALTLSSHPGALARLHRAATGDRDPEVRGQALFWLAQTGDDRAAGWILAAIEKDADREVREQGVFALAQLDDGAGHLMRLLREATDPGIRRQALFWLGQSEDPRALAALEEVLGVGSP